MKVVNPTELRNNIYNLLDDILRTGVPLEVIKSGKKLKIIAVDKPDKLDNLVLRDDVTILKQRGNADELEDIHWDKNIDLDLP